MISLGLGAPSTLPAAPSGESAITVGSVAGAAVAPGSSLGVLALESFENIHFFFYMYHNKTDCKWHFFDYLLQYVNCLFLTLTVKCFISMMHVKCIVSNLFLLESLIKTGKICLFLLESLIKMGKICVSVFKFSFFLKPLIDRKCGVFRCDAYLWHSA